jgi:acetate kinase
MMILSLNCGSSSVKYRLTDWDKQTTLATGLVERVGLDGAFCAHSVPGREKAVIKAPCPSHREAVRLVLDTLTHAQHGVIKRLDEIKAVGHRVVHGGEKFTRSVKVTPEVLSTFKELADLAPLHNPPNILGIEAAMELLPGAPNMAIMDTAWHQTMPASSYVYALPYEWYEKYKVRRYGFHGTSFLYVAKRAAALLGKKPLDCSLVICHIGNGASANAVKKGLSFDTSMGMTPLEGLVMGTRAGDHDAAIGHYIMEKEDKSAKELDAILNKKSGVLGVSGKYVDQRDLGEAAAKGDERAKLAMDIQCHRLKKYIGAYAAVLGGLDAVVFTAGVGEMGPEVREGALAGLEFMGIQLDARKNAAAKTRNSESAISADGSPVKVFVIPTDEERVMVEDVAALLEGRYDTHTHFQYTFESPDYVNADRAADFEKECLKKPELRAIAARPAAARSA